MYEIITGHLPTKHLVGNLVVTWSVIFGANSRLIYRPISDQNYLVGKYGRSLVGNLVFFYQTPFLSLNGRDLVSNYRPIF